MADAMLDIIVRIMAWQKVGKPILRIIKAVLITIGFAITASALISYLFEVSFGTWLIIHYKDAWGNGDMTWINDNWIFVLCAFLFWFFFLYGTAHFIIDAIKTRGKTIKGFSISNGEDIIKKLESRIKAIEDLLGDAKRNGKL